MTSTALAKIKELAFLRAASLIASGNTKSSACEKAGVSVSAFDSYMAEHTDVYSTFLATETDKILSEYETLSQAHANTRQKIYSAALEPDLSVEDALTLESRLRNMKKSIEAQLSQVHEIIDKTPENDESQPGVQFLKKLSPTFRRVKGKASITHTTTVEVDMDNESDDEFIEGEVL